MAYINPQNTSIIKTLNMMPNAG